MTLRPHGEIGLRTPPLPVHHLDAELLAAPFSCIAALDQSLTALDPGLGPTMVPLWRHTEREMLSHFPGMSIDELVLRRDRIWFQHPGAAQSPVPLARVLQRAAAEVLCSTSGKARLRIRQDADEVELRETWRWLTFSLPPDLLLAASGANSERLCFVSDKLRRQLASGGFVEPHLHLKAALGFPTLWASLMYALKEPAARQDMFQSPGAELDEGRGLAPLLLRNALIRLLLAGFLTSTDAGNRHLADHLDHHAAPRLHQRFGATACAVLWRTLFAVAAGNRDDGAPFSTLRDLYATLVRSREKPRDVRQLDPLAWYFRPSPSAHPELGLLRAGLAYLQGPGATDILFAKLFWQTVRARNLFYRHIVQRPMVPGLQWFARTYGRLWPAREPMPLSAFVSQAAALAGPGLRSLEVRITPQDNLANLLHTVMEIDKAGRALTTETEARGGRGPCAEPPEVGIVFHFSRTRGRSAESGIPAAFSRGGNDDPSDQRCNPSGYRFSGYYHEQQRGAATLARLLVTFPRSLEIIRGVDLCTDELGVPLWVVRPLIQHVLRASRAAASALTRREGDAPPPLGLTVHAGEDFVHLIGGIRRVAESIELLDLAEGSRIGHGVALGVHVREWAVRSRRLHIPRGERLRDLIWAWREARAAPEALRSWLPWIEQELAGLSGELFDEMLSAETLARLWERLHDPETLRAIGFPDGPRPAWLTSSARAGAEPRVRELDLLYRWITDPSLFQRTQEQVTVAVEQEIELIEQLQAQTRQRVAARGIVIEVNPSSNLLIGHLGSLESHPLWRICPPEGAACDAPPIHVCIGSDDPITFSTSLPEEYQLLADALSAAGVSGRGIDAWIEGARQCGLTSRFTLERSAADLRTPVHFGPEPASAFRRDVD